LLQKTVLVGKKLSESVLNKSFLST
jgi:hypothetical protein